MKVLVAVASKHGSTLGIAQVISAVLTHEGHDTTLLPPDLVGRVDEYDAVVLGSAVYMGQWMREAKAFAAHYRSDLATAPTWLFSSGPLGDPPQPVDPLPEVEKLREFIGARDHRVFSGRLDPRRLGLVEKAMVRSVKAPEGDYRMWSEIEAWARGIAAALKIGSAAAA